MHRRRQHGASDRTPYFIEPQICAGGFSDVFRWRLDAKNCRQARSMAHSSLAPPPRILQRRQMAPIQLDSITMSVNKLLDGHTKSISGPILRGRDYRLTAASILCEKIGCLRKIKILCTSPCGIPRLLPTSFYARPPRRLIPCWPHQNRR